VTKYNYSQLVNIQPPKRFNRKTFKSFLHHKWYIINRESNKPLGGLWSSTYTPDRDHQSEWIEWCAWDMPEWIGHDNMLLEIKDDARIYKIDTEKDLSHLYWLYPSNYEHPHNGYMGCFLDFTKIAKEFDIIWLTAKGQSETRYHIEMPGEWNNGMRYDRHIDLYGWDCESSLILNNVVNRFKKITTTNRSI
jgi:hypothetical protein